MAAQSRATEAHFSRSGSPEIPHSTEQTSQASMQRTVVWTQGTAILLTMLGFSFCMPSFGHGSNLLQPQQALSDLTHVTRRVLSLEGGAVNGRRAKRFPRAFSLRR